MSEDRFEKIQKLWYSPDDNIDGSDVYWLIAEVRRLREENAIAARLITDISNMQAMQEVSFYDIGWLIAKVERLQAMVAEQETLGPERIGHNE